MGKMVKLLILSAVVSIASGCSSGYFSARGRDAADIFTFTIGPGMAAKARIGPIQVAPVSIMHDSIGVRAGEFCLVQVDRDIEHNYEQYFLIPPDLSGRSSFGYYRPDGVAKDRGKTINEVNRFPFIVYQKSNRRRRDDAPPLHYQATQIEVAAGLIFCVRAGFNIGEFFDFFLGWFGVDIYNDDDW